MDDKRDGAPGTAIPGQTCQVCGAETRSEEPLCDACARTVDTIVDTPLPPIPDGGLSRAMPDWLRSSPHATVETTDHPAPPPNEFASILSDEDIPVWLKRMAERHATENAPVATKIEPTEPATQPVLTAEPATPPTPTPAPVRRVMVGAVPPRPIEPAAATRPSHLRRPPVATRTALAVGLLAAIAALVILAIVLFG